MSQYSDIANRCRDVTVSKTMTVNLLYRRAEWNEERKQ